MSNPIVCVNADAGVVVPGSIQTNCSTPDCNQRIYLSPSGQKLSASGEGEPMCIKCVTKIVKALKNAQ